MVHKLTLADIEAILQQPTRDQRQKHQSGMLANIFSYIGGLLIVGGLTVLIHMKWDSLDYIGHILITFIPAMLALCLGIACTFDERFTKAATPLFLLAATVEPTAIIITLKESHYLHSADQISLLTCLVMAAQQGLLFCARRRTVLAFIAIAFTLSFFATGFDMELVKPRYIGMTIGTVELCLAYALARSPHRTLAPVNYFFGSVFLLSGFASCVYGTPVELTFLGLCCLSIYASVIVRSRALLGTSAFAMLSFIGYYSGKYFAHTIGWPITLIVAGGLMIGLALMAIRIGQRYIVPQNP